ncbi:MAG: S8 family serine peptidase [Candidatus Poseidoniaceae archaeon]|nr:S8 family serine peptidase [Candidatus Poseidoniaceae archaeon]
MNTLKRILSMSALVLLVTPMLVATIPVAAEQNEEPIGWWTETTVDRDGNGVGDMVERYMYHPLFLDDDGRISLIFDFDHTPTNDDIAMLTYELDYEHQFSLPGIDAVAGTIPVVEILDARDLPGIVMIELDGILEVTNGDARVGHGVDVTFEETGYDGSGTTVAIIDTGLDGLHASIDDMDDDNSTDDHKILAFYDAVNNASNTNGTDFPYDDHGHGSHCGGTTAGTGAPDYEHVGMAPQAHLVGVKVLDGGGSGSFAGVMAGMQWTIDTMHNYNTRAASMSLGGPGAIEWTSSEEDSVNRMANEMVRSGIALFIAAGNNGVSAQIGTPGSAEDVITVGALDKDTGIAPYSSQGPTEEGRVKPNIAYMGSSIMSVAANTGDGYTAMSGTSMATPGAAGVGALMFQADPDLSPFDIRNIMQETATYRECHYMAKNEPCAEDFIPKNRQNNVYGHGHTNSYEAVMEAAQRSFTFNKNITLTLSNQASMNGDIHLSPGDSIRVEVTEGTDTVQWMSNDLRDGWSNIHSYEHGDVVYLTYEEIAHELEHLPGTELAGNHTLSMRGIKGTDSSPLITLDIMLGEPLIEESVESSLNFNFILWGSLTAAVLLSVILVVATVKNDRTQYIIDDADIDEVVEAELE